MSHIYIYNFLCVTEALIRKWRSKEAVRVEHLYTELHWVVSCENVIMLRGLELGLLIAEKWLGRWRLFIRFVEIPLNHSPPSQHWLIADCKQAQQGDDPGWGDSAAEAIHEGSDSWGYSAKSFPSSYGIRESERHILTSITVTQLQLLQFLLCFVAYTHIWKKWIWLTGW